MEPQHGGRITLRRAPSDEAVEYVGEASTADATWPVRVHVASDGAIAWMSDNEASVPEWLAAFLRATLRTAWRATRTGAPWPRRLHRWRPGDGEESV